MHKVVLIIFGLVLAGSVSAKESIQGHYDVVGNVPAAHSLKKVVYEEFMNFGCPHCNNLHKASRNFRKIFADKVEFIDIPISSVDRMILPCDSIMWPEKLAKLI